MNQLSIPFELRLVDVLAGEQKSGTFLAINPLGVVPYLKTETGTGIGESNAMLWYLAEGTNLMPSDKQQRAETLQWMFFEQSKLEPFISPARFFTTILPQERTNRAAEIAAWQEAAKPGLLRLNSHLRENEFMLRSGYSIADIAMFGYVHVLDEAGLFFEDYPCIERWVADVSETDGFVALNQLGMAKSKAA